jgi:hypothetical protein
MTDTSRKFVRTFPVAVWFPPVKNTAASLVRMRDQATWKLLASAATRLVRWSASKKT